ncbi:hypothetical protein G6L37_06910 [Agrobacterium rubi]|nr:hypothetical protein [Agrobacterium rubi]NTF25095.1 hypothetical protein [Agrobacterium rubi]
MTELTTRARRWIATGSGLGTTTLWAHMMGVKDFFVDHPHDRNDLVHVLGLLKAVPEWEERVPEMADLTPVWAAIVVHWRDLKTDPSGMSLIVKRPTRDEDRMTARLTAMMARLNQPVPSLQDLEARYASLSLEERANSWIVSGDVGQSSKTVWATMLGITLEDSEINHPHDPADIGRCLRLLSIMPEWQPRISELASLSPTWKALAERWADIRSSMETEAGIAWEKAKSAPATYDFMRSIIDNTRNNQE